MRGEGAAAAGGSAGAPVSAGVGSATTGGGGVACATCLVFANASAAHSGRTSDNNRTIDSFFSSAMVASLFLGLGLGLGHVLVVRRDGVAERRARPPREGERDRRVSAGALG